MKRVASRELLGEALEIAKAHLDPARRRARRSERAEERALSETREERR